MLFFLILRLYTRQGCISILISRQHTIIMWLQYNYFVLLNSTHFNTFYCHDTRKNKPQHIFMVNYYYGWRAVPTYLE